VVYVLGGYDPVHRMEYAYETHQLDLGAERARLAAHLESVLGREPAQVVIIQHVLAGPPAKEIARVARSVHADLVVVGTHGKHGVKRLVLGSVAEEVLRGAHCPVLVARTKSW
jgi:nucleotide-binding universal stress UspA family protein